MPLPKFYICEHCKNLIEMLDSPANVPVVCCAERMKELIPNSVDASSEKHVPVISVNGDTVEVSVGSVAHPMLEEHCIEWICLACEHGVYRRYLSPGEEPRAVFSLNGDKPLAAYAYCNIHGLWVAKLG